VVLRAGDHEVVAVVCSADDCVTAVTTHKPDACLLDMRVSGPEDDFRAVREIRSQCAGTAVLMLSDLNERRTYPRARDLGVAGLLGKDRSVGQLTAALDAIVDGGVVFDPGPPEEPLSNAVPADLTPRETEVLRRMAAGQDTRRMASEMNVTVSTLRTYVKNILAKLGAHTRLEAVTMASRAGLPDPRRH
jgi:DNA-binding NarL/FixJ family response regulator